MSRIVETRPCRRSESLAVFRFQAERIGQELDCVRPRCRSGATLQIAQPPDADAGSLCQRLLAEAGRDSVPAEQTAKLCASWLWVPLCGHAALAPSSRLALRQYHAASAARRCVVNLPVVRLAGG